MLWVRGGIDCTAAAAGVEWSLSQVTQSITISQEDTTANQPNLISYHLYPTSTVYLQSPYPLLSSPLSLSPGSRGSD